MKAFVIMRDRVTYAHLCVTALTDAGLDPVIIDHGSTWPLALDWLAAMETAGIPVIRRGPGHHPRSVWDDSRFRELCGQADRYLVTDCDVIPADTCPLDWLARLGGVLDACPGFHKAGLGLRADNIPRHYPHRDRVIAWESTYWSRPIAPGVFAAPVDTTLALYRPLGESPRFTMDAVRTGPPYMADHLAWFENPADGDPEIAWYHDHAEPGMSFWTTEANSAWGC